MPRAKSGNVKPSAAGRFMQSRGDKPDGKLITLADVTDQGKLWTLLEDAVQVGVAVTISRTRDGSSISLAFFSDGERVTWYLAGSEDWQELVQTVAI